MILSSATADHDIEEMLAFYKNHFESVEVVSCNKCKNAIAFQVAGGDPMGLQLNEIGKIVIGIGDKLMAHRVRLDEAPTGERMVGYQCACGNNSKLASVEVGKVPVGTMPTQLSPFEKMKMTEEIKADATYKPGFKRLGNKTTMEKFTIERVK